jgi:hypothetical protein
MTEHVYRVVMTPEDGWLMLHVPELDLLTQARHRDEAELMATDLIAVTLDVDPSTVRIRLDDEGLCP